MKIGDKVRFLSEIGGGRVAGFQGKDIVLVEDEDGFQVPMRRSEVVVIGQENYDTSHVVELKAPTNLPTKGKAPTNLPQKGEAMYAEDSCASKASPFGGRLVGASERKGGEQLSAYLAFVPIDVKELTQTRFETYFVNDSNYYMHFTYMSAEGNSWRLRSTDEVEPNTKLFIEEFGREDLNGMERIAVQLLPYKREKPFLMKSPVDVQLRVDAVKFYKLHTFQENDFFEQPALLYTIIKDDTPVRSLVIDAQQLKQSMYGKDASNAESSSAATSPSRERQEGPSQIVVDLHADALLDTTQGMTASDILNYQLDVFRRTLKNYEKKKGTRIIFIHGKGEGVLRKALVNELQYRYKHYTYQDASFQEYGYGATQVTIK